MKLMKKILLTSSIILAITGCANNPPLKSDKNLPKVTEFRAKADRNSIGLEWSLVNKPNVYGYYIQRSEDNKDYKQVAKIENRYITHWVDKNLKPGKIYYYKISTYTKKGIPSFAKSVKNKTLPTILPISYIDNAGIKTKGIAKIIFRPHSNERVKGYYIERFNDKNGKWNKIADLTPRLSAEYIDKGLTDGKVYRYRIIAYTFDGLKSKPSKELVLQTLQKPKVVLNLQTTNDLAKKIKITWKKVPAVKEYKIYYSSYDGSYKLLATTKNNYYLDVISKDGVTRYYKVTAVDKYGLESLKSQSVMGVTLPLPVKPVVSIERGGKSIKFILSSPDKRAVKYLIKKDDGDKIVKIHNVKNGYVDRNIMRKKTYTYKIYEIDENGLVSEPTTLEVEF